MPLETKTVLHVGCGGYAAEKLHPAFREPGWQELRLDIDADAQPDVVASITNMEPVDDESMDAVFSAHNIEHLYPHEVALALREFRRVLKPTGMALVTVPDLQSTAQLIADGKIDEPAYTSQLGPITPLDIVYGFRPALADGNLFMAHHTGFTGKSLLAALSQAGFPLSVVQRSLAGFSLWAIGFAASPTESELHDAQQRMLPLHMARRSA